MYLISLLVVGFLVSCTTAPKTETTQKKTPEMVWLSTPGSTVQFPVGVDISQVEVNRPSKGDEVKMVWDSNTEASTAVYRVYMGTEKGKYNQFIDIGKGSANSKIQSFKILGLTPGKKYYFAVSAYNEEGAESPFSLEVEKLIPTSGKTKKSTEKNSVKQNRAQ